MSQCKLFWLLSLNLACCTSPSALAWETRALYSSWWMLIGTIQQMSLWKCHFGDCVTCLLELSLFTLCQCHHLQTSKNTLTNSLAVLAALPSITQLIVPTFLLGYYSHFNRCCCSFGRRWIRRGSFRWPQVQHQFLLSSASLLALLPLPFLQTSINNTFSFVSP